MKKFSIILLSTVILAACQKNLSVSEEVNLPSETTSQVTTQTDFGNQEKNVTSSEYNRVLEGDLSAFLGEFSTDEFNQIIVDSDFTYGGYSREDYMNNRTSIFPRMTESGFWNGITSHGTYEVLVSDLPQKISDYYQVTVYGVNAGANNQKRVFYLVPPNVTGPTDRTSSEKTVFEVRGDDIVQMIYQKPNWWENYEKAVEIDLDIEAINSGDFSSLVGTWANGRGEEFTINQDGTTSFGGEIVAVPNSDKISKIPYASLRGAALGFFKIGFENPEGDQSDTSRPRIVITQSAGNYEPDLYYYRK